MSCEFIDELSKLKKSSIESVDNIHEFDDFNRYMHVSRKIEEDLKTLINNVNNTNQKTLIFLCGSAGDGKSHLLSYLKNEEQLLNNYTVINDATESASPEQTSLETLVNRLKDFNDDNIQIGNSKIILAINLGILNSFITSPFAENFTCLKKYVEENNILLGNSYDTFKEDSFFQHINFSDYQMFSISENEIQTEFLQKIFDKIFNDDTNNPFNSKFLNSEKNCNKSAICPVRHNYQLLKENKYRRAVINRIVEVILKDKVLISTRDVLNLIYNIIVSPNFSEKTLDEKNKHSYDFLEYYISCTTPMLLDEYKDISTLQNYIQQYDILKTRSEIIDNNAISFNSSENIIPNLIETIEETPYSNTIKSILNFDQFKSPDNDSSLKPLIFKFNCRLNTMKYSNENLDPKIMDFIKNIYYQTTHQYKQLKYLYEGVLETIKNWNGFSKGEYFCFDNSNEHFWLLEKNDINAHFPKTTEVLNATELYRFNKEITLEFCDSKSRDNIVSIDIDYYLYELINNITKGYRINANDINLHADFNGFINKIIEFGSKSTEVMIVSKSNPNTYILINKNIQFGDIKIKTEKEE